MKLNIDSLTTGNPPSIPVKSGSFPTHMSNDEIREVFESGKFPERMSDEEIREVSETIG